MHPPEEISIEAMRAVAQRFASVVRRTPLLPSSTLTERLGSPVVLKAENLQRTGSFKLRGAMAVITALGSAARCGVTAGSAGNHAGALAFAARHHGVACRIFVPVGAAINKIEACRSYGAEVVEAGASLSEAVAAARSHAAQTGAVVCHPYDDAMVVTGQGTLGLEVAEDLADLDTIVVPLGGGGLAAGVAIAIKTLRPDVRVIGVQAQRCAPYLGGEVPEGPIATLADGIAVKMPGEITRPLIERWLDDIVSVDEDSIADAMVLLTERAKLFVEGAGAVGVAALLEDAIAPRGTGSICVVLSGGNVDLGVIPGLIRRHENQAGRRLGIFARIDDRPGGLARLLTVFAEAGANLIEVEHVREAIELHVRETGVHATFEVRDRDHAASVLRDAAAAGYHLRVDRDELVPR